MAFAGNPKIICRDPEFVERAEDGSEAFKAGELVWTNTTGYLKAVAAPGGNPVVVLGQVQTDSTAVAGTIHKVQVITPEDDIEIVLSAVPTIDAVGGVYENAVSANVHTLNLSSATDPTFYVKRLLRSGVDRLVGAYDTRAVVRLRPQVCEIASSVAL